MKSTVFGAIIVSATTLSLSSFASQTPPQISSQQKTQQQITAKQIQQERLEVCAFYLEDCPIVELGAGNGGGNEPPLPTIKIKKPTNRH